MRRRSTSSRFCLPAVPSTPTADGIGRTAARRFAMRLQQFSGPVMAKGVEDTAFYRYNRFVALNDVGGAPERFGIAPALFHKANAQRAERWPHAMLATATHDTKRGEDARARLAVLSGNSRGSGGARFRAGADSFWGEARRRRGPRRARPRRRIHVLPDARRLVAVRTARFLRPPGRWKHTEPASMPRSKPCGKESAARTGPLPTSSTRRRCRLSLRKRCDRRAAS